VCDPPDLLAQLLGGVVDAFVGSVGSEADVWGENHPQGRAFSIGCLVVFLAVASVVAIGSLMYR
jgi:hypothetical protein